MHVKGNYSLFYSYCRASMIRNTSHGKLGENILIVKASCNKELIIRLVGLYEIGYRI